MIHHGDCLTVLRRFDAESIDACVTDPPYGIGFMGKEWDTFKPGTGATRKLMHPRERVAAKIVSDNPNIAGRHRSPALSPSQIDYDYSAAGLRRFQAWTEEWAHEVFRVLKPGAHIVVCGAPRAYHRMASGLEDAGFEIRDCLAWLFSTGFPKSLNFGCKCRGNAVSYSHATTAERDLRCVLDADVSPAVHTESEPRQVLLDGLPEHSASERGAARPEPEAGGGEQPGVEGRQLHRAGEGLPDGSDTEPSQSAAERIRAGACSDRGEDSAAPVEAERGSAPQGSRPSEQRAGQSASLRLPSRTLDRGAPDRRARCERCGGIAEARGLGTALKPAHEPIVLARKPFKGTVAENYARFGTGALNIDACRVDTGGEVMNGSTRGAMSGAVGSEFGFKAANDPIDYHPLGRWPANVVIDDLAALVIDEQSGELTNGDYSGERSSDKTRNTFGTFAGTGPRVEAGHKGDTGGASRFYYCAKPSREERDMGCYGLSARTAGECTDRQEGSAGLNNPRAGAGRTGGGRNFHPTVKPVELMRWLVRLVTPINGVVIDPFLGSGTTGMAARYEQRGFIGIEREADYIEIAERRIEAVAPLFAEAIR